MNSLHVCLLREGEVFVQTKMPDVSATVLLRPDSTIHVQVQIPSLLLYSHHLLSG